jgi:hypothetical protein
MKTVTETRYRVDLLPEELDLLILGLSFAVIQSHDRIEKFRAQGLKVLEANEAKDFDRFQALKARFQKLGRKG